MPETPDPTTVTLFVVPNCPLCTTARVWLARHHIAYVERDVKNDWRALRAMYLLTEQMFVPVFARGDRALVRPTNKQLEEFFRES
jgi:glutaredoxin